MEIGLCAWSFSGAHRQVGRPLDPHTPEGLLQLADHWGLHSIECASGSFEQYTPEQIAAFKEKLATRGLKLVLDTGGDNYVEDNSALRSAIEIAARMGAPVVRTTISRLLEGDRTSYGRDGWRAYLDSLVVPFKNAMELARDLNIAVGIENHQDICSWELLELCAQVDNPLLGVTMDVGNALAVGETPQAFARRVLPILKHVHFKDYTVHPSPSGYRLKRCALGSGVVDWPAMVALFAAGAPQVFGCIELGATSARHIRLLEEDYWSTYAPRPVTETIAAIGTLHRASRPSQEDWRTPHERDENPEICAQYEIDQLETSIAFLGDKGLL